ncbi:hypothetical protein [Pseudoalteromonas sp. S16_S37]|uniref:hypothetical protein n=1 Tax=Pseudoalteromonas sp. S16_S37 TaxID=2720228 RepID=UPI001680D86F|nr:hypothetical protein [Pseudoalteromonas sp. S16_S37]MBD1583063.1 hypothetical protein [Pseudoalteromonas sp. S16_S37]
MRTKPQIFISLILLVALFWVLFSFSQSYIIERDAKYDISQLATRVALDLEMLPVAEPLFNYSGDQQKVTKYIQEINDMLKANNSRVSLLDISSAEPLQNSAEKDVLILEAAHKKTAITYSVNKAHNAISYCIPILFACIAWFMYLRAYTFNSQNKVVPATKVEAEKPKLVLNLNTKCIYLSTNQSQKIQLANKPLCFYIALVEFCDGNSDIILNPNKDVPEELISIANRYFERLTVLGHTVRKKPNFSNSLEKTLSEIRAALDETFTEHPELKSKYYPPKAYGEGSRSKLHSYGLPDICFEDVEVIGR